MPTWGEILAEVAEAKTKAKAGERASPLDKVRRKYLGLLSAHTKRPALLYATAFTTSKEVPPSLVQLTLEDKHGLMSAVKGIKGEAVDLILHSPGGQIDATEAIVAYLRSAFESIRVIVPLAAMSAATMIVCACDELVVGTHSQLGPTDPQISIPTAHGLVPTPSRAIIQQFEQAKAEISSERSVLPAWAPILQTFAPAAPVLALQAEARAGGLVREWLARYLMAGSSDEEVKNVAEFLTDFEMHGSHGRPITPEKLDEIGMPYTRLEENQRLQDLALSVFHATSITFDQTPTVKIIENSKGVAHLKFHQAAPRTPPPPSTPQPGQGPTRVPANRQERRAREAQQRRNKGQK